MHVPVLMSAWVFPLAPLGVQVPGVNDVMVTASPDDAVGVTVTGDCARVRFGNAPSVMVWLALVTVKLRVTDGAVLKVVLPACAATTVHVPVLSSVMVVPLVPPVVHTVGVVVVNVTGSPDDAVADRHRRLRSSVRFAKAANVMVWFVFTIVTVTDCCTCGAAAKVVLPAWLASTLQVPTVV